MLHSIKFVKATTERESKDDKLKPKTDRFVFAILRSQSKNFSRTIFCRPSLPETRRFWRSGSCDCDASCRKDLQDGLNVGVYANIIDDTFFVIYKTLDPGVLLKWALTCLINIKFANTNLPTVTLVLDTCFFPKL